MGWFRDRFRKKAQPELPVTQPEALAPETAQEEPASEHVAERCERIIEAAREFSEEKREYEMVTSYLKDIELLTDLPDGQKAPLRKMAEKIYRLDQTRTNSLDISKKLSDVQYVMIEQLQAEIPDVIRRLQANETYQTTIKNDMAYLEGEKMQWTLLRGELLREKEVMRKASCIVFSVFLVAAIVLFVLHAGFSVDITWGWLITAALAVCSGFFIFVRYQNAVSGILRSERNANHAISLLNKAKVKYVNITNAVDYACEKYHVKNARELEYQWEQYLEAVRERERLERTNDELAHYKKKLIAALAGYGLYDTRVWAERPAALLQPTEMSEIKHNLLVRRQKLRARIQYNADVVETERAEIAKFVRTHPEFKEKLQEILRSVERFTS